MPLLSYIDQPTNWDNPSRCVIVRGWCFSTDGEPLQAIRLRAGKTMLSGVVRCHRPDVKAALPAAPHEDTGFEIRGTLPGGKVQVIIEAQLSSGAWAQIFTRTIRVRHQLLPLWLGGGDWMELMFFQMPTCMAYPPRPISPEKFPPGQAGLARPKFSIVTPSFQQAAYLEHTLLSVLTQTAPADEYVVQDGGSSDGSAAIIRRHAEKLHFWASERDGGQADAVVKGFARTSGAPHDLMAYLNSDDAYVPGALAFVADYFARHPEVDVVYGHRIVIDEQAREVGRWFLPPHDNAVLRLNDFVPQETLFWRRSLWDRVGGIDSTFRFALDWDLLLRFEAAGARIVRVPYFLGCFRIHSAQKTSAQMASVGQKEINHLLTRANGRTLSSHELETHPLLHRYLRHSAFIEFLWKIGVRAR